MDKIANYKYSDNKKSTILLWGINSAKEYIANEIAKKYWLTSEDVIHGDKLRISLYDSLSDTDKKIKFPKMHRLFSLWDKWIDVINEIWVTEYLQSEFRESEFVYEIMIHPIIENLGEDDKKVIVWVQILPELLAWDIKWKQDFLWVIWALRTNPELLRKREEEYRNINHNHDNYVYSYLNKEINFSSLPWEDQQKLRDLSEMLNIPISAYLLHLLAKIEYNKAIEQKLKEAWLHDNITVIDTSENFNNKLNDLLK